MLTDKGAVIIAIILVVFGLITSFTFIIHQEKPCEKYDNEGVQIVCGGISYMIENQTYGFGADKFVYHSEDKN